jgi:hypothetical protein
VPPERVVSPICMPGFAGTIQGSAIWHRGAPLLSEGYRASLVLSFCARDASYPDANRTFFVPFSRVPFADADGVIDPIPVEWARHNAWLAQARIGTLLDELPWTEDMQWIADQLRQSIAPIERAIERLEGGVIPFEDYRKVYDQDDVIQMSQPRFQPGKSRPLTTA